MRHGMLKEDIDWKYMGALLADADQDKQTAFF